MEDGRGQAPRSGPRIIQRNADGFFPQPASFSTPPPQHQQSPRFYEAAPQSARPAERELRYPNGDDDSRRRDHERRKNDERYERRRPEEQRSPRDYDVNERGESHRRHHRRDDGDDRRNYENERRKRSDDDRQRRANDLDRMNSNGSSRSDVSHRYRDEGERRVDRDRMELRDKQQPYHQQTSSTDDLHSRLSPEGEKSSRSERVKRERERRNEEGLQTPVFGESAPPRTVSSRRGITARGGISSPALEGRSPQLGKQTIPHVADDSTAPPRPDRKRVPESDERRERRHRHEYSENAETERGEKGEGRREHSRRDRSEHRRDRSEYRRDKSEHRRIREGEGDRLERSTRSERDERPDKGDDRHPRQERRERRSERGPDSERVERKRRDQHEESEKSDYTRAERTEKISEKSVKPDIAQSPPSKARELLSPVEKLRRASPPPASALDLTYEDLLADLTELTHRTSEGTVNVTREPEKSSTKTADHFQFQELTGEIDEMLSMQNKKKQPEKDERGLRNENEHVELRRERTTRHPQAEKNEDDHPPREGSRENGVLRKKTFKSSPNSAADQDSRNERNRADIIAERERREAEKAELQRKEERARERERENEERLRKEREKEAADKALPQKKLQIEKRIAPEMEYTPEQMLAKMEALPQVDESIIVSRYVKALIAILRADTTVTPLPEDFAYSDGFVQWQQTVAAPFQEVLVQLLKARYLDPNGRGRQKAQAPSAPKDIAVKLFFKVVEARNLHMKESKSRDPYCTIEFGDLEDNVKKGSTTAEREFYKTEVKAGTKNPVWNQHLDFTVANLTDSIIVSVWDDRSKKNKSDEFLGRVKFSTAELVNSCAKEGYVTRWCSLQQRDKKDKYVEGEVMVEMAIKEDKKLEKEAATADPEQHLRKQLVYTRVSFRSIYKTLLRATLNLDMATLGNSVTEATDDLLTVESKAVLAVFGRQWAVGEAFRVIALLDLLFNKYKSYEVPTLSLLSAYETVRESMKKDPQWLSDFEKPVLVDLLERMHEYYRTQITKYKEFYPKNQPRGALETTLLMLRMIHKNPIYREAHADIPDSFRDELKALMTEASINRYQKLQELTAPFDESDTEAVIDGLCRFAEMLSDEIQADMKYFDPPFSRELVISKLTAETYLKYFVLSVENHMELFGSDEIINVASKHMFDLYKKIKFMDQKYAKMVPGLKRITNSAGFNVERWFYTFISKWLANLSEKTLVWVQNAVNADKFEPVSLVDDDRDNKAFSMPHSTSITDVFSAIYSELDLIMDLNWGNTVQNATFLQNFAKTINRAIEQYCDAIAIGETKEEPKDFTLWTSVTTTAANIVKTKDLGPQDIAMESCVKLCNIEFAARKLEDIYKVMNVATVTQKQRDHRKTMAPLRRVREGGGLQTARQQALSEDESIHGAFKIEVAYAENLKAANKNGLSNAYAVIKVPEGTVVEPSIDEPEIISSEDSKPTEPAKQPQVLTGLACELIRTRVVYNSINPQWDESFQVILPPVNKLTVAVCSKNMIASDEGIGSANIDIGKGTRLKRRLIDHQTHDVFVELEPQGRVLIRMTLEGEDEDVEFWFRRIKERLGRTRDDFTRALVSRLSPYCRQVVLKAIKNEEAANANKGFFTALTTTAQLSDLTAAGISIDKEQTDGEVNLSLRPMFDYLDKNLGTLCESLSEKMAREVIKRIWDEMLTTLHHVLIPALYGEIERDRRVLVKRQTSVVSRSLVQLKDFFHADGEGFGLPMSGLENRKYREIQEVIKAYHWELPRIMKEYTNSVHSEGREKEYLLRIARLRFDREETLSEKERFDGRMWVHEQIVARRDRKQ